MNLRIQQKDKQFIKINQNQLNDMFSRWVAGLKEDAFVMPSDNEDDLKKRDRVISAIKFFETILSAIEIITKREKPKEGNKNFI